MKIESIAEKKENKYKYNNRRQASVTKYQNQPLFWILATVAFCCLIIAQKCVPIQASSDQRRGDREHIKENYSSDESLLLTIGGRMVVEEGHHHHNDDDSNNKIEESIPPSKKEKDTITIITGGGNQPNDYSIIDAAETTGEGGGIGKLLKETEEEIWPASSNAPSLTIALLIRNKAHTLPWFLYYLERLDYPKDRIRLWIRSDHNMDDSVSIVRSWLTNVQDKYYNVDFFEDSTETNYSDASGPFDWSYKRVDNVIRLRQLAIDTARKYWSDFLLFVDADNFLVNPRVLKLLISEDKPVITPMLNATASPYYSNFWGDMDESGYYKRSSNYVDIHKRFIEGTFRVPVVHSTILIQLRSKITRRLAYDPPPPDYNGVRDDIIIFAKSAVFYEIPIYLVNKEYYGLMLIPMQAHNSLQEENSQFLHMKLENIVSDTPLQKLPYIDVPYPPKDKLTFDQVFMINLERRSDRRKKMVDCFEELGINATIFDAIDGSLINNSYLKSLDIKVLPVYADPYHGRTMTLGEIGCFLSHYFIWQETLSRGWKNVVVFEDDVRFRLYFREKLMNVLYELQELRSDWDLVYLGRKRLFDDDDEPPLDGSETLIWPDYSYWTLGYMLSYEGAWKLVQQNPLQKLVPVDEYLPIMFDKHKVLEWKEKYRPRNLVALSTHPLLIEPTLYTGEPGYITDTEESVTVDVLADKSRTRGDSGIAGECGVTTTAGNRGGGGKLNGGGIFREVWSLGSKVEL